mmetsp:Transcript_37636/g.45446  ORF Transcript_37636/g.45446 Transcript_37636/m.45446 type:complete len:125 (+) Transcript_37636:235-609(+)
MCAMHVLRLFFDCPRRYFRYLSGLPETSRVVCSTFICSLATRNIPKDSAMELYGKDQSDIPKTLKNERNLSPDALPANPPNLDTISLTFRPTSALSRALASSWLNLGYMIGKNGDSSFSPCTNP